MRDLTRKLFNPIGSEAIEREVEEPPHRGQRGTEPVRAERERGQLPGGEHRDGQQEPVAERPPRVHCANLFV